MNSLKPQMIFEKETHAGVRQDKRPPRRSTASLIPPQTANTSSVDRPAHHGSETRRTSTISGRAPFDLKARIAGIAHAQGLTISEVVVSLVKKALQAESDLQYGALLEPVITKTIKNQMQVDTNRTAYLASRSFYAAEETRLLMLRLLSLALVDNPDLYEEYITEARRQARINLSRRREEEER